MSILQTNKSRYTSIIEESNTFTEEAETLVKEAISEYTEAFLASR